jgi:hypothetical protein
MRTTHPTRLSSGRVGYFTDSLAWLLASHSSAQEQNSDPERRNVDRDIRQSVKVHAAKYEHHVGDLNHEGGGDEQGRPND